ncbi:MAG: LacI family DNA-binding transcriptional regulator [Verrucomicrobiae bacterium]|nr:LacI family DNA-binding transcriptional regulator [Verrucomicrobiae bacterium]
MADIARKAGVSYPTVSVVLNNRNHSGTVRISEATQQRVRQAAKELGYCRNEIARAMAGGSMRVIGFLTSGLRHEYLGEMLEGVLEVAEENGYLVKVVLVQEKENAAETIQKCIEHRVAGLICTNMINPLIQQAREMADRYLIPLVIVDNTLQHKHKIRVLSDDRQGVCDAVDHLISLGHRRIAFLSGSPQQPECVEREAGYRQQMQKAGVEVSEDFLVYGHWKRFEAEQAAACLLKKPDRPTAIICVSDFMAMAAIRAARSLGIGVPGDFSVVGFSNCKASDFADPPLTTVFQPFAEMGQTAVQHLLGQIQKKRTALRKVDNLCRISTKLVVRESTARAPATVVPAMQGMPATG